MRRQAAKVSIIIPHAKGKEILRHCLGSLTNTNYLFYEILLVDNGSTDGSREMVQDEFPWVRIVETETNLGFAGGCNLGIRASQSPYVVLLNNDTEVTPNWLSLLVDAADTDATVGAVQPKVLSFQNRQRFDYSGGAGGEIDLFGYPFVWGRLFDHMEIDNGQYDHQRQVFWATGAVSLIRRSALDRVGLLEPSFFAHMEEIDLNWRLQWAGYHVVTVPSAVVFHQSGASLGQHQFQKMVLNHRNSLVMVLRNHTTSTLLWVFPIRLLLELITIVVALGRGQPNRAMAVVKGFLGTLFMWKIILKGRRKVKSIRCEREEVLLHRMYRGSVALAYFLRGVRRTGDLLP